MKAREPGNIRGKVPHLIKQEGNNREHTAIKISPSVDVVMSADAEPVLLFLFSQRRERESAEIGRGRDCSALKEKIHKINNEFLSSFPPFHSQQKNKK